MAGRPVVGLAPKGQTTGRKVVGLPPAPGENKSGGGGFLHAIGHVAHVAAQKAELGARDIKGIPGGIIEQANTAVVQPWKDVITTGHVKAKTSHNIDKLINQVSDSTEQTLNHPGRDPLATLLTLSPILHGAGRIGSGAVEATRAVKAGEGVKGAVRAAKTKPEQIPRSLKSGGKEVPLIPSRNAAARVVQHGYDKTLQKALDSKPEGRVAAHAQKRIGGALKEEARGQQKIRAVPASMLDRAATKLSKKPGARREEQAALELTSVNTSAEDAAAYHEGQAAKGVNVKQNLAVARLYGRVAARGLLTKDAAGNVVVDAVKAPKLAKTDTALARVQSKGDEILVEKGVRDAEALKTRRDAPARIRAGATYEAPTPGKLGVPSQTLIKAQARVARLESLHARATEKALKTVSTDDLVHYGMPAEQSPIVSRLSGALSVAKEDVQRLEGMAAKRVKPTGIVGGTTARPGRGFVSERVSDKKLGKAEASASQGPVVGAAKAPIDSKPYTGRALEQGLRPKHVTAAAAQHFRQIVKFVNTDAHRRAALETGSDVKRSTRDVLVREPDVNAKPLTAKDMQAVGKEVSTVDTAEELATAEGLRAAHEMLLDHILPGRSSRFATDRGEAVGAKAPDGYKWVDRNALGDLTSAPQGPRGKIARSVDNVNSAVTALTVYFKIGHVGTRVLTNAATNIIQGSANPLQVKRSYQLWDKLSEEEQQRALAGAGQHGFASLPHEGNSAVARFAGKGAQWWAKHADAMFRFNSLAYELRRVGYKTPAEFNQAIDHLESGGQGLPAHEWSRLSAAARRSDREAISYDRLNEFEKRYLTRAVWFFPWIKGSTLFTVRTAVEHPFKAAFLGQAGVAGREKQMRDLGETPSYEAGLVKLFGGGNNPGVADFSTFSPFATAADVIEAPGQPGAYAGFLNPVAGATGQLTYGLNQYGGASQSPYRDALLALGAATPEQQLAEAYASRNQDQSGRMFQKTPESTLLRYLVGPGLPRRVNKGALASAAAREKSGRR